MYDYSQQGNHDIQYDDELSCHKRHTEECLEYRIKDHERKLRKRFSWVATEWGCSIAWAAAIKHIEDAKNGIPCTIEDGGAWTYSIARNAARKRERQERQYVSNSKIDFSKLPFTPASDGYCPHLDAALNSLPPRQKEVVILHCIHELTIRDMALQMKIKPGTAFSYLQKAIPILKELLSDFYQNLLK